MTSCSPPGCLWHDEGPLCSADVAFIFLMVHLGTWRPITLECTGPIVAKFSGYVQNGWAWSIRLFHDPSPYVDIITDFGANRRKLAYPTFHSVRWHSTTDGRIATWMRALTVDDPSSSDENLVNFGTVTPEFCMCVCAGRVTRLALPRISSRPTVARFIWHWPVAQSFAPPYIFLSSFLCYA